LWLLLVIGRRAATEERGRGVVLGDIVRQLTYVSGLVPGERLFSVTLYLEKISVCVCLYWSFNTFMFVVLYCMQLCFPVLIFFRWGLKGAGAHLKRW